MNIIAVDDEREALQLLEKAILEASPGCNLRCFCSQEEALAYVQDNKVDIAFLDIEMPGVDGISLAENMIGIHGKVNIIFTTGHSRYAVNAFSLPASGYILKPVRTKAIKRELFKLRYTAGECGEKRVMIKCFGGFGVFVDNEPLLFTRSKSKELLAYLVHKQGAGINNSEIAAVLWENQSNTRSAQSNARNVIAQLMKTLKEAGVENIVRRVRNSIAVNVNCISCDYYDYMHDKSHASNAFTGEYMSEYSWAEYTAGYLHEKWLRR